MKMKKVLSMMCAAMLAVCLAMGCSSGGSGSDSSADSSADSDSSEETKDESGEINVTFCISHMTNAWAIEASESMQAAAKENGVNLTDHILVAVHIFIGNIAKKNDSGLPVHAGSSYRGVPVLHITLQDSGHLLVVGKGNRLDLVHGNEVIAGYETFSPCSGTAVKKEHGTAYLSASEKPTIFADFSEHIRFSGLLWGNFNQVDTGLDKR